MWKWVLCCLVLSSASLMAAETMPPLLAQCTACHGNDGISAAPNVPIIAGLPEQALRKALEDYRDGRRTGLAMEHIVKTVREQGIIDLAGYFSAQTFQPATQETDPEKVARGARFHTDYCEKCHRQEGRFNHELTARLAGQWSTYLTTALLHFHQNKRPQPENMAQKLNALIEEEGLQSLEDLAEFYASRGEDKAR